MTGVGVLLADAEPERAPMLRAKTSGAREPEEEDFSPSSSGTDVSGRSMEEMFVRHRVSKLDTLAGLAVKYNVSVSDIKRSNGLLSDLQMYARDTLLIPRQSLPVGPEYSTWVGMIVTQYGRIGPTGDSLPSDPAYAAFSPRSTSIQQLRGYYSTGPSRSATPQYDSDGEGSDRHHLLAGGAGGGRGAAGSWQSAREVELMVRTTSGAASAYAEDRLRRRRGGDSADSELGPLTEAGGSEGAEAGPPAAGTLLQGRLPVPGSSSRGGVGTGGSSSAWHPGRWKQQVLERMKRVSSQPQLSSAAVQAHAPHLSSSSGRLQQLGAGGTQQQTPSLGPSLGGSSGSQSVAKKAD